MVTGIVLGVLCVGMVIGIALCRGTVRAMRKTVADEQNKSVELSVKVAAAMAIGRYLARRAYEAESRHSKTSDFDTWLADAQAAYEETTAFKKARDEYYAERLFS